MSALISAFVLGNGAILTNVCILPLYPGLIAFLAGQTDEENGGIRGGRWLGLLVLAGVLSLMLVLGGLMYLFQQSLGAVLPWLLPVIYGAVIILGVMMLAGRNPFAKLQTVQAPLLRNPYVSAYLYGLLLGPMTLPCAGPLIVSAFLIGSGSAAALVDSLLYVVAFGIGFGWPLVVLPWVAMPLQRRFTGWVTGHYDQMIRFSGVLLVGIGLVGIWVDLLPNL
ncbi:MAG TPA: cytochrome c biogenesis protein CcdA [Anaerolineae bacterium]|nr:cytochrome c biogenesis protein CcdA [Anaerolineae bacterium]